ncbi:2-oxoacid dehydrogenase acyltransferase [Phialemonium atrogriseum]|uniref:2-oxoacid dehydrogenase acyltransferase n=1 Tax=Phialemonium atrogriseum TaxID=1093897 RepID=A0AAJ0BR93_9PEZI|nr:2-oxoacid dehydrogenase acyltransferase [Phialemonium atrogriseum]KAK1761943.1 2-oxoacid dehydrogenase acyltransferase [Phialemonium atrogriseum]
MFQSMTRSLAIPHFLYTRAVDLTPLMSLRKRFAIDPSLSSHLKTGDSTAKLTPLPFVLKALSQAVTAFLALNSILYTEMDPNWPHIIVKAAHNFGVAIDTRSRLLVSVVKNVQNHSVISLAAELSRVGALAREGCLGPGDMRGATLVVSNIGSIGGQTVAPVILSPMTAVGACVQEGWSGSSRDISSC